MVIDRPHLAHLEPCPHLPNPIYPMNYLAMRALGRERGPVFYETALQYAGSLWRQGLPARCLLLINRSFAAELRGDETILKELPLPYLAVSWVLTHRPETEFIGNPRRHYQHLATRMTPPRQALRTARAWACWYLSTRILPESLYPADLEQIALEGIVEPTRDSIAEALDALGLPGERALWESAIP